MRTYIIAEAGVNHNGSVETAKKLIEAAKFAGADCVKFQTFKTENIVAKSAKKADYQIENTNNGKESQFEMLKKLELTHSEFIELKNYSEKLNIDFMSTAFDLESVDFLSGMHIDKWKIPSGDLNNLPLLIKIANLKKPVILSTGMATLNEVKDAIKVLNENGSGEITVLHCTTDYPTKFTDVNLKAMLLMKETFNLKIGYSDHTLGIEVPIAAVALGATVIEKHFTLSKDMNGPDHKASLNPEELKLMVDSIRNIELSLGNKVKNPQEVEMKNSKVARKSLVAKVDIIEGDIFTNENLTVKRPGTGISPMEWFNVIGTRASKNYKADEMI